MDNTTKRQVGQEANKVQMLPIDKLVISPKNPRKIFDDEFKDLKESIQADPEFLMLRPILVQAVNDRYVIYGGTQRYKACKELGYTEVPCIVSENLDHKTADYRILADNSHFGDWDEGKLFQEFSQELQDIVLNSEDVTDLDQNKAKAQQRTGMPLYRLEFPNRDDRNVFYALLEYLQQKYSEMSVGERVKMFLTEM